ncbi:hypothetical protein OOZ15_05365 [Galbibacter sp. EGI 63066]|uniref:hypothetical protein n=1 Tax=Galbibacter sp. EGI 63066 TaxID=2993559 RepID=UPI00224912BE|nr:hypothetical protein [Galbibacter sp. EGI 63066]MCX2679365.1 hypothetical protein [Galbibacter sp. EGI 63066]
MRIQIDTLTITKEGGRVFGNIYFTDQEFSFPEKGWNDFVIIILNWWCSALKGLLLNERLQDEFLFMDGPFTVRVTYLKEEVFNLIFLSSDELEANYEVPIKDFSNNYLREINSLIRKIDEFGWNDEEIESLKINYRDLKMILKNYKIENT